MKNMRISTCGTVCAAAILLAVMETKPVSAQDYYGQTVLVAPAYPLPSPNYVVYSPSFIAWRSAGYYGGNWGPYYYEPAAFYPLISGTTIWPTTVHPYPPVGWYASPW